MTEALLCLSLVFNIVFIILILQKSNFGISTRNKNHNNNNITAIDWYNSAMADNDFKEAYYKKYPNDTIFEEYHVYNMKVIIAGYYSGFLIGKNYYYPQSDVEKIKENFQ